MVEVTEWDAEGRTVVTLAHVPDGTVIPNNLDGGCGRDRGRRHHVL